MKKQEDETETGRLTEQWREKNVNILTPNEEELGNLLVCKIFNGNSAT